MNSQVVNVKSVMDTWTLQMGYPVVTIKTDPAHPELAIATQKHFLIDQKSSVSPVSKYGYNSLFQERPRHL